MKRNALRASRLALAAAAGTLCLFVNDNMSSTRSDLLTQANAEIGRPLTAGSVAGVARRHERRAVRRDAYIGGGAVAAGAYYGGGYAGDYYSGYANRSFVTGRPTLLPRYYGGAYGAYAAGGYSGDYYGGYANRSYVTGRPTLIPRYYGGAYGAYASAGGYYDGAPLGYYGAPLATVEYPYQGNCWKETDDVYRSRPFGYMVPCN